MLQKRDLLQSKETFRNLDHYRYCLNRFQSLVNYTPDLCGELIRHADEINRDIHVEQPSSQAVEDMDHIEVTKFCSVAASNS